MRSQPATLLTLALVVFTLGCGEDTGRVAFTGSVRRGDAPVNNGAVNFRPVPGNQGAPATNAVIEDGVYEFDTENGPMPGAYLVRITVEAGGDKAVGGGATTIDGPWDFTVEVSPDQEFQTDFAIE